MFESHFECEKSSLVVKPEQIHVSMVEIGHFRGQKHKKKHFVMNLIQVLITESQLV